MTYPCFIAFEVSSQDESGFPVSMAWSLPDGTIKHSLIEPEDDWLDDSEALSRFDDLDLSVAAHSAAEVVKEFLFDQQDDVFYMAAVHPHESWLMQIFAAANEEVNFEAVSAAELFADPEWEETFRYNLDVLGLNPYFAEDQIRAFLETFVQLQTS